MRVIVVGAGIGGLTAAALLHRSGHDVEIIEKASAFGEVGAGIQISPNGARVLAETGLADVLADIGTTPARVVMRRWEDDRELLVRPLGAGPGARYGFAYYNVYRPDLIDILATAVSDVPTRLGIGVVRAAPGASQAYAELEDGTRLEADVVVGADGIHSAVRSSLFGHQPTRFSGWVAYRALVPRSLVPDLPVEVTNRVGPNSHLVSYFVGRDQRFLNLVCVVPDAAWDLESWNEPGDLGELRHHFETWSPDINAILDHVTEPVFRWALHDRTPLDHWSSGNVTILGDACHPMVPFMAQGACQSIEDAAVLSRALALDVAPADALAIYEATRKPRASDLQRRSFDNATTFHLPDGPEQARRDELYDTASRAGSDGLAGWDWLYGHNIFTAELASPS